MGYPIKLTVNAKGGDIELTPPENLRKALDLHNVEILPGKNDMTIRMTSAKQDGINPDSIIHKVIKQFETKSPNYKDLSILDRDCYVFISSCYEIPNEDFSQIIYDYIDSLNEELNIGTALNQINEAVANLGHQRPKVNKQEQVTNPASPRLSIFNKNEKNPSSDSSDEEFSPKNSERVYFELEYK